MEGWGRGEGGGRGRGREEGGGRRIKGGGRSEERGRRREEGGGEKGNMSMSWDKHELFICLTSFTMIQRESHHLTDTAICSEAMYPTQCTGVKGQ